MRGRRRGRRRRRPDAPVRRLWLAFSRRSAPAPALRPASARGTAPKNRKDGDKNAAFHGYLLGRSSDLTSRQTNLPLQSFGSAGCRNGTGSWPAAHKGWQRARRHSASQPPRRTPCRSIASPRSRRTRAETARSPEIWGNADLIGAKRHQGDADGNGVQGCCDSRLQGRSGGVEHLALGYDNHVEPRRDVILTETSRISRLTRFR